MGSARAESPPQKHSAPDLSPSAAFPASLRTDKQSSTYFPFRGSQRNIHITDRSDHIFRHLFLVSLIISQRSAAPTIYFQRLSQIGIPIGYQITVPVSPESAHAAISSALYADIGPEIFIIKEYLQDPECSRIIKSCFPVIAADGRILYLPGRLESLIFLLCPETKKLPFSTSSRKRTSCKCVRGEESFSYPDSLP